MVVAITVILVIMAERFLLLDQSYALPKYVSLPPPDGDDHCHTHTQGQIVVAVVMTPVIVFQSPCAPVVSKYAVSA